MNGSNESQSLIRFGHVTAYDATRQTARVNFPDLGIESFWLPVLTHNSLKNHHEAHLDIGEHVACIMAGTGTERGVVLGAFYDDKNKPLIGDRDIHSFIFEDGTEFSYDRKNHSMIIEGDIDVNVNCKTAKVSAQHITLEAERIDLIGGHISLDGSVTCPGYCRC